MQTITVTIEEYESLKKLEKLDFDIESTVEESDCKRVRVKFSNEMVRYLNEHRGPNPFPCEHLVVVPENLYFDFSDHSDFDHSDEHMIYEKGTLLCFAQGSSYPYCTVAKQALKLGEDGNVHMRCKNKERDLTIKVPVVEKTD